MQLAVFGIWHPSIGRQATVKGDVSCKQALWQLSVSMGTACFQGMVLHHKAMKLVPCFIQMSLHNFTPPGFKEHIFFKEQSSGFFFSVLHNFILTHS